MLYIVQMDPRVGADLRKVQDIFNLANDWHRLGTTQWSWIIDTEEDAGYWSRLLQPYVKPGGELFICKLDPSDRNGWKPKSFWRWFREAASQDDY